MFLRLAGRYYTGYTPTIKFPDRHGGPYPPGLTLSGKKIKMTNREALNQAMS